MKHQGMVYLVGAGPGAWGLMTIRGLKLLESCDAVVYDHLASHHFLSCLKPGCRKVYVGKQAGCHSMSQEEISGLLVRLAKEGLTVVRLKGGDPFVFGRGGEEILALEENEIPWEIVPGVTSAVAVPELAGIPVTHRGLSRSFHVITGHTMGGEGGTPDMRPYAALSGTLVFLMGFGQLSSIAAGLIAGGKSPDTPAAVIENGSLPNQRVLRAPLGSLAGEAIRAGLGTPAIIVVGEVAAFELCPKGALPLSGTTIGITGTPSFAARLRQALEREGADVRNVLEMKVIPYESSDEVQKAYRDLEGYTWLVLTSANGVQCFFEGLYRSGRDFRAVGHLKFAVIGKGTAGELEKYGFRPDFIPESYCARSLGEGLVKLLGKEDKVLLARAAMASKELPAVLSEAGIAWEDVPLYDVMPERREPEGETGSLPAPLDYLVFASASGVRGFFGAMESRLASFGGTRRKPRLACIGDITAKALGEHGQHADVVASSYDIDGIVRSLEEDVSLRNESMTHLDIT